MDITTKQKQKNQLAVRLQWRMQDFPEGAPTYYLTNFFPINMKMKNFWPGEMSLAPPSPSPDPALG